jgi:Holliday junction DNA helicase RuvB
LNKPGDLAGLLTNLEERDVLFVMKFTLESHCRRMPWKIVMIESGPNARTVQINLNPFTLMDYAFWVVDRPMRLVSEYLPVYNIIRQVVVTTIVERSATIFKMPAMLAAIEIAGRGTPRIANIVASCA